MFNNIKNDKIANVIFTVINLLVQDQSKFV